MSAMSGRERIDDPRKREAVERSGGFGDNEEAGEKQDVTLSLPRELVREAKIIAARKDTSISGLVVDKLRELVEEDREYEYARERDLRRLAEGFDLGTGGAPVWSRDESHER